MSEYVAKVYENEEYILKIIQDFDPINPREDDNLGHMVCFHRDYNLGDKHDWETEYGATKFSEYVKIVREEGGIALPLYLYDHSGLAMRTGRFAEDSGGWDTSMVGYIYITKEEIEKEYGSADEEVIRRVENYLRAEVETYSQFLEGDVWGFDWEKKKDNTIEDSCWGFYGSNVKENGMWEYWPEEIRQLVDSNYKTNPDGYWANPQLKLALG